MYSHVTEPLERTSAFVFNNKTNRWRKKSTQVKSIRKCSLKAQFIKMLCTEIPIPPSTRYLCCTPKANLQRRNLLSISTSTGGGRTVLLLELKEEERQPL